MKFNSILFTVLVFLGGCGEPNLDDAETLGKILAEAIDGSKLLKRGEEGERLFYAPNEQSPYTGWIKEMYNNGQVKGLCHFKDGKQDGLFTQWFENGQKQAVKNYKDGKRDGVWTFWYKNGQKLEELNYKDGKQDGLKTGWYENGQKEDEINFKNDKLDGLLTDWYDNGQKESEGNFKADKLMSLDVWKPNGEKCPVSNIVNGNGVTVTYDEDGTEKWRNTFKDGKEVD